MDFSHFQVIDKVQEEKSRNGNALGSLFFFYLKLMTALSNLHYSGTSPSSIRKARAVLFYKRNKFFFFLIKRCFLKLLHNFYFTKKILMIFVWGVMGLFFFWTKHFLHGVLYDVIFLTVIGCNNSLHSLNCF